jgi:outer membrane receptor for ferrienterochelin and colicins
MHAGETPIDRFLMLANLKRLPLSCRVLLASISLAVVSCPSTVAAQEQNAKGAEEESEEIVVQATRSGRRVQDEPVRVEVIDREEIKEKILMVPGNIAMVVAETGGLRVQVTSPALGAANIRVRGLEGRYTQLVADGLPLYGQASSLGLLQIPPTDLGRVEVIKGAASAFYGPSALGGVINLVSRRPAATPQAELLLNATSRDGQDATAYAAAPLGGGLSGSIAGGAHRQRRQDLDGDGWIDMPGFTRFTLRPRLFLEGASGAKVFATVGAMTERRDGGTLPGRFVPDGQPFEQDQDTTRVDAGLVAELPVESFGTVRVRASGSTQDHRHRFGDVVEDDRHRTAFAEASVGDRIGGTSWVAGVAFQLDDYRNDTFPLFDYSYSVPGVFAQVEHDLRPDLTFAGSARADFHSDYGTRLSPRVSLLWKPDAWTVRASLGRGFFAPTPFVDEIEDAGLSRLAPLRDFRAETADTASLDLGYAFGRTELNASVFASRVDGALRLEDIGPERVRLVNAGGTTRTHGVELLARHRLGELTVTGSYVHIHATEPDPNGGRRQVERTPRGTAGVVAMWEREGRGRIGFETYYTGRQRLEDNPYRTHSRPYVEMGLLGELIVGRASLFVNLENLLNVRQTRYDPLLRPARAPDGRWTVDVWAPTEGFVTNAGVRLRFGGDE